MSTKSAVIAASSLLILSVPALSQNLSLDFDDNHLPPEWSIHSTTVNKNFGFANGRFYAAQTDSGAYIEHALNVPSGQSIVTVDWTGSVFQTYWGNFSSVKLKDSTGKLFVTSIGSASYNWGNGIEVLLQEGSINHSWILPLASGTYAFESTFSDGAIAFVGYLNGTQVFSKSIVASTLNIQSVDAIRLHVYETVGPDMWIDNVNISAVPEASSYSMFLLGIASLSTIVFRRRSSGA